MAVAAYVSAAPDLAQKLSGRILLQVQSHGEAWYINPNDLKRYYLGRPADAFDLMKKLGLGVKHEIIVNNNFSNLSGKILIDVGDAGKAYYINPTDKKAYYLGRPYDAFQIMRQLGLGITNENLNKISIGYLQLQNNNSNNTSGDDVIYLAAEAIRSGNTVKTLSYFTPEMQKAVEYTMNFLDSGGKLILGNILSGSELSSSSETEKIYTNEVYFSLGGYNITVKFKIKKQPDGKWLIANL